MSRLSRRRRAAFLLALLLPLAIAPLPVFGQTKTVEVPAYRALGASEAMSAPGNNGGDYSANAPSLSGLALLATIPAAAVPRLGYLIQAQCRRRADNRARRPGGRARPDDRRAGRPR